MKPNAGPTSSTSSSITPEQPRFTASLPTSSTRPARRPTVPRLTTLPGHRFSLITSENESASARLTPSVIIRQPAVPLNLPTLRVPSPAEADGRSRTISTSDNAGPDPPTFARRMSGIIPGSPIPENRDVSLAQSRRHLRTMPALPMAGTDKPDDGDGDESDGGDGRDSDEEEDEDTDADGDDARSSMDSPNNAISPVDVSRIDLSFLKFDPKGKERAYDHNHDSSRTPTARTPRVGPSGPAALTHDYFSYSSGQGSRATTPRNPPVEASLLKRQSNRALNLDATHVTADGDGVLDSVISGTKKQTTSTPLPHDISQPPPTTTLSSPQVKNPPRAPPPSHSDALIVEERRDMRIDVPPPHLTQEQHPADILVRRRSMLKFDMRSPPPPYPSHLIQPGDGCERLPSYTNNVLLRAIMPMKLEFAKPGIQAKDRKWRKVVCELEGTVFRVYRCPPAYAGTPRVIDWWERRVGVGDISVGAGTGKPLVGSVGGTGGAGTVRMGVGGGAGSNIPEEMMREQERLRAEKLGETGGRWHTEIPLPVPRPPQPWSTDAGATNSHSSASTESGWDRRDVGSGSSVSPPSLAPSRIVSLLESHRRARSGSGSPTPTPYTSRSSFNLLPRSPSRTSLSTESTISHTSGVSSYSSSNLSVSSLSPSFVSASSGANGTQESSADPSPNHSPASSFSPEVNSHFSKGITCPPPQWSDLLRVYTLQHAESGLGNDYLKRKNVIRVRMEGEQFLLQARDVTDVVEWVEGLHSAMNIALDLDERPMPRGPLFPRRRRRRPHRTDTDDDVPGITTSSDTDDNVQGTLSVPV
ncbi:hypothetical protein BDP27DRAFT_1425459 [Rhodocollybia butyracea]|uniref:PH domain-containing protein n=1 Tax=Rhodocollybia butyracea TaxID=206335 RepID=A0A9P5PK16_9AGAR|nr:hypothetical protein BDP27DRAFT_1425459 [Rhodocollybia butyracea]